MFLDTEEGLSPLFLFIVIVPSFPFITFPLFFFFLNLFLFIILFSFCFLPSFLFSTVSYLIFSLSYRLFPSVHYNIIETVHKDRNRNSSNNSNRSMIPKRKTGKGKRKVVINIISHSSVSFPCYRFKTAEMRYAIFNTIA
jgi:hypothetical protein